MLNVFWSYIYIVTFSIKKYSTNNIQLLNIIIMIYLLCIYINAHTYSIYSENIYVYLHVYIYINLIYIINKYI